MFATPAVAGGLVYVASCAGTIYAFDVVTGTTRWRYQTSRDGPPANFHGDPVLTEELLVLAGDKEPSARIYAFDRRSGAVRWSTPFDGGVSVDVLRRGDTLLAYTRRGDAVALDLATGKRLWTYQGPRQKERPSWTPALAAEHFVFAARPRDVFALQVDTGALTWHAELLGEPSTSIVLVGESLIVGTRQGRFYRLDPGTGSVSGGLDAGGWPSGTPVVADDCLFALIEPDCLACLDPALTRVRWRVTAPKGWSSPRPLVRGGEVVVGTKDGEVVAFSFDGREVWRLHLEGEVRGLGCFQDLLFVGTREGTIYAVRLARPAP